MIPDALTVRHECFVVHAFSGKRFSSPVQRKKDTDNDDRNRDQKITMGVIPAVQIRAIRMRSAFHSTIALVAPLTV